MGIGVGIFLVALGAVLAFAVTDAISGVDLTVVGYILMAAGLAGIVIGLILNQQRSNTSHTHIEEQRRVD
jgi:Domain of unknown function (DUF6458)